MYSMHAPPANLSELAHTLEGLESWDTYIARCIDDAIQGLQVPLPGFTRRLDKVDEAVDLPIYWNAFPKGLMARFGRERAMVLADLLWPIDGSRPQDFDPLSASFRSDPAPTQWMRPHNEYCEWRVERHPQSNRIKRVVFTSETYDYWQAWFGGRVVGVKEPGVPFFGDRVAVVRMYRKLVPAGAPLKSARLCKSGSATYDPFNRWNTTHGIVHTSHPDNSLAAAIDLCARSTLLFADRTGHAPLTVPEAVCCAGKAGDPARASDLTVLGTGNALARQGARLALAEPIGIYIDHIDTSGWRLPGLKDPGACCRVVRGTRRHALRVVVEAPAGSGTMLNDLTIGGEPLMHGGQIAECVTMRALLRASFPGGAPNSPLLPASARGIVRLSSPGLLVKQVGTPGAGEIPAFEQGS